MQLQKNNKKTTKNNFTKIKSEKRNLRDQLQRIRLYTIYFLN